MSNKRNTQTAAHAETSEAEVVLTVVKSAEGNTDFTIIDFDDRLVIIQKLNSLKDQFLTLDNKIKELNDLSFSTDRMNSKITFKDDSANMWETTNTNVIDLVRKELSKALTERKAELKEQIEAISI